MKRIHLFFTCLSFILLISCKSSVDSATQSILDSGHTHSIPLNKVSAEIGIGERVKITPILGNDGGKLAYAWSSSNERIVNFTEKDDCSISVVGMKEGETVLTIFSPDKSITTSCTVKVVKKTIKILAIGNSFSDDAIRYYLHGLIAAEGIDVIIGNMYIAGCSLETHCKNLMSASPAYNYRKIGVDGKLVMTEKQSLQQALQDEDWDYISFQEASPLSGKYSTYEQYLPRLVTYVRDVAQMRATLMLHQTWAYAQNTTNKGFANYNDDQMTMYRAIVSTASRAAKLVDIDLIIPAGTAIQNARTSFLGDSFCHDGYHLQHDYGRYTASCAWFEKIFNRSVVGNSYAPEKASEIQKQIAQHAAHYAVLKPDSVTKMVDYEVDKSAVVLNNFIPFSVLVP